MKVDTFTQRELGELAWALAIIACLGADSGMTYAAKGLAEWVTMIALAFACFIYIALLAELGLDETDETRTLARRWIWVAFTVWLWTSLFGYLLAGGTIG